MKMDRQTITCKLKGHIWHGKNDITPDPKAGTYWVHDRCFRCGKYRKELRHAVAFQPKEQ